MCMDFDGSPTKSHSFHVWDLKFAMSQCLTRNNKQSRNYKGLNVFFPNLLFCWILEMLRQGFGVSL